MGKLPNGKTVNMLNLRNYPPNLIAHCRSKRLHSDFKHV